MTAAEFETTFSQIDEDKVSVFLTVSPPRHHQCHLLLGWTSQVSGAEGLLRSFDAVVRQCGRAEQLYHLGQQQRVIALNRGDFGTQPTIRREQRRHRSRRTRRLRHRFGQSPVKTRTGRAICQTDQLGGI